MNDDEHPSVRRIRAASAATRDRVLRPESTGIGFAQCRSLRSRWIGEFETRRRALLAEWVGRSPQVLQAPASPERERTPARLLIAAALLSNLRHGLAECLLQRIQLLAGRYELNQASPLAERLRSACEGIAEARAEVQSFLSDDLHGVRGEQLFASEYAALARTLASLERDAQRVLDTPVGGLPSAESASALLGSSAALLNAVEQLRQRLDHERVELRGIVDAVLQANRELLAASALDVALHIEPAAKGVRVFLDRGGLECALTELVRNAVRHGAGPGTLEVRIEPAFDHAPEVWLTFEQPCGAASSPGPADPASRPSTREGLCLVREIVEGAHCGRLECGPTSGGSHFRARIVLPLRLRMPARE